MRRKPKIKLTIISILLIIICADIIFLVKNKPWKKEVIVLEAPIPINLKITNTMSSFEETQRLDKSINNFIRKWDIKGASFALMKDEKLIYAKGYGYADVENKIECEVKHLFRIASVSKLITGVAVMKLKEAGKLKLDDKVFGEEGILNDSIFLNITDKQIKNITVEHLLRHTGGFSRRIGDPMFNQATVARILDVPQPLSTNDIVCYAAESRLRARPGTRTTYSNMGYLILSKIIEKVSGTDYETYIQKNILHPIGCYDMYIGQNKREDRRYNEVKYYEVHDAEPIKAYDGSESFAMRSNGGNNIEGLYGAGGWIASPVEISKLISAISSNSEDNILSNNSIDIMTQFSKKESPIGWASITKRNEWIRTGTLAGTSAFVKRQSNGYTWTFITNTSSWKGSGFTRFINREIGRSITNIKEWPQRDLFVEIPTTFKINSTSSYFTDNKCF